MIWLWLICFSLLKAGESAAATVTGQVTLADSREPSVRERKDYSGVVVWLEAVGSAGRLPAPGTFVMEQKGKRFLPHVLVVPIGATVDFPNFDPIFHNAFSNFSGQPFDTGLYAPGTSQSVHFRRPGIVRVFCNIHSTMSAVIVVLPTHLYAVTSSDGTFGWPMCLPARTSFVSGMSVRPGRPLRRWSARCTSNQRTRNSRS